MRSIPGNAQNQAGGTCPRTASSTITPMSPCTACRVGRIGDGRVVPQGVTVVACTAGDGDDEDAPDVVLRVQPAYGVRPRRLGGSPYERLRVDTAGALAGHGGGARARQVRPD